MKMQQWQIQHLRLLGQGCGSASGGLPYQLGLH
jgi:hypothetical protein